MNKEARRELANKLTDAALMEIQELMAQQYRSGYEYTQFRAAKTAELGITDKSPKEILDAVTRPMKVEEFRSAMSQ